MMKEGKKVVYVCSKYSGDIETNSAAARNYCRVAVNMGYIPLAPHLLFPQFMSEEKERNLAMTMDLELIDRCDEFWVCGPEISSGMKTEIEYAKRHNKPIRRYEDICLKGSQLCWTRPTKRSFSLMRLI